MAELPDGFKDGDALEPVHLNAIFAELRRWRAAKGAGGVTVSGADGPNPPVFYSEPTAPLFIKITGAYSSGYPWKEVLIGPARTVADSGVTGDSAYELQSGDTTLTADGTIYEAKRSPASGELYFDGKN